MTRRMLFSLAAGVPAAKGERVNGRVPTTEQDLNRFASRYNEFVESLRGGIVDIRAWERVRRAWREMTEA